METVKKIPQGAVQHRTAGPYSPVLEVETSKLVVISGQAPVDQEGKVISEDFARQTQKVLENCREQLASAGCTLNDVFKCNVYLTDLKNWGTFNQIYRELFLEPRPVRTAVQAGLLPGFQVEVEMWAAKK